MTLLEMLNVRVNFLSIQIYLDLDFIVRRFYCVL